MTNKPTTGIELTTLRTAGRQLQDLLEAKMVAVIRLDAPLEGAVSVDSVQILVVSDKFEGFDLKLRQSYIEDLLSKQAPLAPLKSISLNNFYLFTPTEALDYSEDFDLPKEDRTITCH